MPERPLSAVPDDPGNATQAFIDENGFDPWETDDPRQYDRDRYYTRSASKGDSSGSSIRVNIPQHVFSQIKVLVQSRRIPQYRTHEDVIRDGIYHNLHYRNQVLKDPALDNVLTLEMMQCQLDQLMLDAKQMADLSRSFKQTVKEGLRNDNGFMVESAIQIASEALGRMSGKPKVNLRKLVEKYRAELYLESE